MLTKLALILILISTCVAVKIETTDVFSFTGEGTYVVPKAENLTPTSIMWCFMNVNCPANAFLVSNTNQIKRSVEGEKREIQSKRTYFWTEMVNLHSTDYTIQFEAHEEGECLVNLMCEEGHSIAFDSVVSATGTEMYRFAPSEETKKFYAIVRAEPMLPDVSGGGKVEFSYLFESDPIVKQKRAPDCFTTDSKVFEVQLFGESNVLLWVEPADSFHLELSSTLPAACTPIVDEEEFLAIEAQVLRSIADDQMARDSSSGLSVAAIVLLATLLPLAFLTACFLYFVRNKKKRSHFSLDYPHWASNFLVWANFEERSRV